MMPKRVRMSRQKPWRAENPDAISVARPTKWGNPFYVGDEVQVSSWSGEIAMIRMTPPMAVECFRDLMRARLTHTANEHPDDASWVDGWRNAVAELRGHDLVCWCPLDAPCHADVLLALANGATR